MISQIYDEGDGIRLEFDLENGLSLNVFMDDAKAQDMVNIIQNKLNARFG